MKTAFEPIKPDEGSSFRLLTQQVSAVDFGWAYHYHPEYELVYVDKGRGRRHVGNYLDYYEAGDLVLIGSNLPHAGFGYDAIEPHQEIVIQFKEDFLGDTFFNKSEMDSVRQMLQRSNQGIVFLEKTKKRITEKLIKLSSQSSFYRLIIFLEILYDLSIASDYELLNPIETQYDFKYKDELRLKKIYQFVEQNYQNNIELSQVAALASLTIPSFCNYFKKIMQMTFTDFVNEYRINQACKLLFEERQIVDICYAVGFNNVSYFSKIFGEIKGTTPREYRKMIQQK